MKRLLILSGLVVSTACGGGGDGLTLLSVAQIAGSWAGTMDTSNAGSQAVTVTLTQSSDSVTGTWAGTQIAWQGNISGKVDGVSFTGTFTFSGTTIDGTVCTAEASFSGGASTTAQTLQWSSPGFIGSACPAALPSTIILNLTRH